MNELEKKHTFRFYTSFWTEQPILQEVTEAYYEQIK